MEKLIDSYNREFRYLRLSVTDRCNFRCVYCLPDGCSPAAGPPELSVEEIFRLCSGFHRLGFGKIRLTGGEPTVRKDIVEVVSAVSRFPWAVGLTTNAHSLEKLARPLYQAGLRHLNVSLDSLEEEDFRRITGSGRFASVVRGIEAALACGYSSVKINAVLLRGLARVEPFLEWVRERPVSVRFIELMRTGSNAELFSRRHLSAGEVRLHLLKSGWSQAASAALSGPAIEFRHPGYVGSIGLIAPYSRGFCEGCNRLRVSSRGKMKLCLFGEGDFDLRPFLNDPDCAGSLARGVRGIIGRKPESHYLKEGKYGDTWDLASIGG
ncbi:MAG: GTP 3',8-cyclase MoaA [Bdellovibrionales bacterium]|nr:GTP 3',8-cyclase MoaA [Bdellovibrionales bacterium]